MSVNLEAKASAESFINFVKRDTVNIVCTCKAHAKTAMVKISAENFIKFAEFSGISVATNKGAGLLNCAILSKLAK
jgi:hypothetical protein